MKNKFWILLIVAICAVPVLGQVRLDDDEVSTEQRCIDCDVTSDVWSGGSSYENGQYMDNPCTSVQDWVWIEYAA